MSDFPLSFNVSAPSKFCTFDDGLTEDRRQERARKLVRMHGLIDMLACWLVD